MVLEGLVMNNGQKIINDEEMGYFFGSPTGTYSKVLCSLDQTRVNSCETSSIPLAEFWQPSNLGKIKEKFETLLPGFDPVSAKKHFEFPTYAKTINGERIGAPSMTDLMVFTPGIKMAIEGKFTEYVEKREQTIANWLEERKKRKINGSWTPGSREEHLRNVLLAWFGCLRQAGCTGLADDNAFFSECMEDVSYQFLHRAASACCKADVENGPIPVLVYQLFFDANSKEHIAKMDQFKDNLRRWAETLKLQGMKFFIVSVPILNAKDVRDRYSKMSGGFFHVLENRPIYIFDFDKIMMEDALVSKKDGK